MELVSLRYTWPVKIIDKTNLPHTTHGNDLVGSEDQLGSSNNSHLRLPRSKPMACLVKRYHASRTPCVHCTRRALEIKDIRDPVGKNCNAGADHMNLGGSGNVFIPHTLETECASVSILCKIHTMYAAQLTCSHCIFIEWYLTKGLTRYHKLRRGQRYRSL